MAQTDRIAGYVGDIALKLPCRVATTGAITLSGLQTIDGVAVAAGDRVLVKNQASAVENGIYFAATGTWPRTPDFDGARDVVKGTTVSVTDGDTLSGYWFKVSSENTNQPGADMIGFAASVFGPVANLPYADAGGSPDAITATYTVNDSTLADGYSLLLDIGTTNATTAPTFAPTLNGVLQTARTIVKYVENAEAALAIGDLNGVAHLVYDLTNTKWVLQNPSLVRESVSVKDFGSDPTGVTDSTPALVAAFTAGGEVYIPEGDYLIANAGADAGGVEVTMVTSIRVTCHPNARFFTDSLDNDFIRFIVPSNGAGLPTEKLTFEWYGGFFDMQNQKNSTNIPHSATYPGANVGSSATCDAISIRGSYTSGTLKNALSLAVVKYANFYAGPHWEIAGGDSGVFIGDGCDVGVVSNCHFTGIRDDAVYGSWDSTGILGGALEISNNTFENCFFAIATKRSASGFDIHGNEITNCVNGIWAGTSVGSGIVGGTITGNTLTGCTRNIYASDATGVVVTGNLMNVAGALDNSGAAITVYNPYPSGVTLNGCTACTVMHNEGIGVNAAYSAATGPFLYLDKYVTGTRNSINNFIAYNYADTWYNLGYCDTGATSGNRFIQNVGVSMVNLAYFSNKPATDYEERWDVAANVPIYMTPQLFADGTAAAPAIARRSQTSTGVFFAANKIGLSASGIERFAINGNGIGFFAATPVTRPIYGIPTGTATRTAFDTATITTAQLAEHVKALIDDLRSYGLVG